MEKENRLPEENDNKRPTDISRIDINAQDEVRWWCSKLSCNEMRLKNAVRAVGPSPDAVRNYITKIDL
jgi:hypothetical protein